MERILGFVHTHSEKLPVTSLDAKSTAHDVGYLLLVCVTTNLSNDTLTIDSALTPGWSMVETAGTTGTSMTLFSKVATSSNEPMPTINSTGLEEMAATTLVIKDLHANFLEDSKVSIIPNVNNYLTPSLTTVNEGSTVLHFVCGTHYLNAFNFTPPVVSLAAQTDADVNTISVGGFVQIEAGVTETHTVYNQYTTSAGIHIAIAIRDSGTTQESALDSSSTNIKLINPMSLGHGSNYLTKSRKDPISKFDGATIDGWPLAYRALDSKAALGDFDTNPKLFWLGNSGSDTANLTVGELELDNSINLTDTLLAASLGCGDFPANSHNLGQGGHYFGISDGDNVKLWLVDAPNSVVSTKLGSYSFMIDPSNAGYYESGIVDLTRINGIVIGSTRTSNHSFLLSSLFLIETDGDKSLVYKGGSLARPFKPSKLMDISNSQGLGFAANQKGLASGQHFLSLSLQVGDGTKETHVDWSNQSLSLVRGYSEADGFVSHNISQAALEFKLKASDTCDMNFSSCTIDFVNFHRGTIDLACSGLANFNFSGFNWLNCTPTFQNIPGLSYRGFSISGSRTLNHNGSALAGVTIAKVTAGQDSAVAPVNTEAEFSYVMSGVKFVDNTNAPSIIINGNQSGSWLDPLISASGGLVDIKYTGDTDFSIQSALALIPLSTGLGILTIDTPIQTFTLKSNKTDTVFHMFVAGSKTLLASGNAISLSYVFVGNILVDYVLQKAGFLPIRKTGVKLTNSSVTEFLSLDPVYFSAHGLVYGVDSLYDGETKRLTNLLRNEGRNIYSLMIDSFIAEVSLLNVEFDFAAIGIDSLFFLNGAEMLNASSEDNFKGMGGQYLDTNLVKTKEWLSFKTTGNVPAAALGEYQQTHGSGTTKLRAAGNADQIIQIYGDADHGDFTLNTHLVVKFQVESYLEVRLNVPVLGDSVVLESFEYSLAVNLIPLSTPAGSPAINLALVDHVANPLLVGTKLFNFEIQDLGTNSAASVLQQWNFDKSGDTPKYSAADPKDPFNWFDAIEEVGNSHETRRGYVEGVGLVEQQHGFYVSRGGVDHPEFTQHQSNDGSFYVKPILANISVTGLPYLPTSETRLELYNTTTDTVIVSEDPAGLAFSLPYIDGDASFSSAGDVIRVRFAHLVGSVSFELGQVFVIASSEGINANGNNFIQEDLVYRTNAIDGSSASEFSVDFLNKEIDLSSALNSSPERAFSYYCYVLTTPQGISDFWGGVTAIDKGNYRNNDDVISLKFDNTTTGSVSMQGSGTRWFRLDGTNPVRDPTTSGFGVALSWEVPVSVIEVNTGTATNKATVKAAVTELGLSFNVAGEVNVNVLSMNDTEIIGGSGELDKFRSVNE